MALTPQPPPDRPAGWASDLVRQAFEREFDAQAGVAGNSSAEHAKLQAAEQLASRLLAGLSQWFGGAGTLALASRALSRATREHPGLAAICLSSPDPALGGLAHAAEAHGAAATVDGVLTMLTELVGAMGRLVNDELAAVIFARSAAPHPRPTDGAATTPAPPLPLDQ